MTDWRNMPCAPPEETLTVSAEAFRAFDRWCKDHDPDGDLEPLERVVAYSTWAASNSIAIYLDAAQPPSQEQKP